MNVWFIPSKDPTVSFGIISRVGKFIFIIYEISIMGADFCTVIISKQLFHLS
jgi:anti-sigma-K factor RskA